MPHNTNRAKILEETLNIELIPLPRKILTPNNVDHNKHCRYLKNFGYNTEECTRLRDRIEELIQTGHLKQYVQINEGRIFDSRDRSVQQSGGRSWEQRREENREEGKEALNHE